MSEEILKKLDALLKGDEDRNKAQAELSKQVEVLGSKVKDLEAIKGHAAGVLESEARNAASDADNVASTYFRNILARDVSGMQRLYKEKAQHFTGYALPGSKTKATTDYHMYTSDNASGGYAVPTSVYNELARVKAQTSVLYPLIRKVPQQTAVMTVPTLATAPSMAAITQAGRAAATKPVLGVATLTLARRSAIVVLTKEMVQDTVFGAGLTQIIIELLGEADGVDIDTTCFQDSTSPFTGMLYTGMGQETTMSELTADAGLNFDYLSEMEDSIVTPAKGNCKWFLSRTVLGRLRREKDSVGQPLLAPAFQALPSSLLGYPYHVMDNGAPALSACTTGVTFMILGDPQRAWMGEAGPMEIEMSTQASVTLDTTMTSAFDNGLVLIKGETRRSFAVVNATAFAQLTVG